MNISSEDPAEKSIQHEEVVAETIIEETNMNTDSNSVESTEIPQMTEEYLLDADVPIPSDEIPKPIKTKLKPSKQIIAHVYPCTECERSFPLQQLLDIHMRQHTRERKFTCGVCNKKFFTKNDLTKHVLIHTGEKPYACVACDKTFSRINLLHRHEKTHITAPKYLCTHCDKTYLNAEDLEMHAETHKKKRPFKCTQCPKSFAFKQGLDRHEAAHYTENPHKCNYCDESFTTPGKLARHIQSHAGARPYPCKLCHRTFLLSHHLTRHLRLHYRHKVSDDEGGEHKCDYCSMSFRRKDSLIHHTAIHSMVNLKCVICNKEFSDVRYVKEHVNTHLSGLQYPCDKCDYSFETQDELDQHDLKHALQEVRELEEDEYIPRDLEQQNNDNDNESDMVEERLDPDFDTTPLEDEFTLRRSTRNKKVKNYVDFLKDELPDSDDESNETEDIYEPPKLQIGMIPPVIRSETIKTYKGVKDKQNKSPLIQKEQESVVPDESPSKVQPTPTKPADTSISIPKSITKITTLENLGISKQTLESLTKESGIVEMKVGQKIVRVQPLKMTKSVYQAMAKNGQLERKGSKVVVQNVGKGLDLNKLVQLSKTSPEGAVDLDIESNVSKTPVRTYVKKSIKLKGEPQLFTETELTNPTIDLGESTIDLDNSLNENETQQAEFLENLN